MQTLFRLSKLATVLIFFLALSGGEGEREGELELLNVIDKIANKIVHHNFKLDHLLDR